MTTQSFPSPRAATYKQETSTLARFWRNNALTLVMMGLFTVTVAAQLLTGWKAYNQERHDHGQPPTTITHYLTTGHFWEAIGENWESEFLQMGVFIYLTACLHQKGSPESNDPDAPPEPPGPVTDDSPWPVRKGGWIRKVYENSLTLCFLVLFLLSFAVHAVGGAWKQSDENAALGQPPVTVWEYLGSSECWFESFQNWQSEFLSIAAMVYLSIYLRQKGSPESKAVEAANSVNE